ncbi:MAG: dihydropteroate synthase [Blastochloris sp.]|nr:dihydropteroate synthase [Blastochloris sp.]
MLNLDHLRRLAEAHEESLGVVPASFELKGRRFATAEAPHLMGVINLSQDSWYRESVCLSVEAAVRRGRRLAVEGAHLVDVGAESSLSHAQRVDEAGQKSLLLPVVKGLAEAGVLVSVETYHPSVTEACLQAGAAVLNLTGTGRSEEMYRMVADHEAGVILCFVQGENVREVDRIQLESDHTETLKSYFGREIDKAVKAGVSRIWIDPGLGFYYKNLQDSGERVRYQMQTFLNSFRLRSLGWPVCHALPHAVEYFEDEVRTAEGFFAVLALLGKTDLLRTHEVARVQAVARTMRAFGG